MDAKAPTNVAFQIGKRKRAHFRFNDFGNQERARMIGAFQNPRLVLKCSLKRFINLALSNAYGFQASSLKRLGTEPFTIDDDGQPSK